MAGTLISVVLSGISGKFPESDGLDEFRQNLYNGVDMVTDSNRGWTAETYKIPRRMGQLKNLNKFDADFFGVHSKQAENMDPRLRLILETSHECITDAGINISELSGSNTGVYVGASGEESNEYFKASSENHSGYAVPGSLLSTFANRTSFSFNLRGPSITMDTACSSSLLALQQALLAIRFRTCDSALVAGASLCLDPRTTLGFTNFGMTTADGKCKSFDSTADGYVRSEAVVAVYICKEDAARRCYATILHASTNTDGYKVEGFTYPSSQIQEQLLRQVYRKAGVDPKDVGYIEAHGTGTQAGDYEEISAISRVLCSDRDPENPLLVGSVKSNMGHSEPASGLCGIAKLVLIAQSRIIPGNLHFSTPNPKIPGLLDGRIKVVSSNTPFHGDLVAINSFGFGGSNVHALLKLPCNETTSVLPLEPIPIIMPLSGRTTEVALSLEKLAASENRSVAALLHKISRSDITGHGFRSYTIINGKDPGISRICKNDERIKKELRPLWFIFAGTGTQYEGMAEDMMKLDPFRNSIENSINILKTKSNFDLKTVLSSKDQETINNVTNSIVSIVAIQLALVDLLEAVGIVPNKMAGHSLGEIATAYSDKCLTAEQALMIAIIRAQLFKHSDPGAMASVGLSWEEALEQCPSLVYPACDNSADNVTISGNAEVVENFVVELQSKGIFARVIQTSGMAYHSVHIHPCGKYMREQLPAVIPDPKPRSERWVSTSVPENEKLSNLYRFCSADYWTNNALAPVRFHGAIEQIPANAVAIEVGPHCVLQAILKRSLPPTVTNVGIMSKKAPSNCLYFLEALGELYLTGHNPDFAALYERAKFPLGPSTPMISPVIRWDHSQSWIVPIRKETRAGGVKIQICPNDNKADRFYLDHVIDGRVIFPGVGYMYLVWTAFARKLGKLVENCPVTFDDVRFERSTIISTEGTTEFHVVIHPDRGDFEVFEGESATCRGRIQELTGNQTSKLVDWREITKLAEGSATSTDEIYKSFRLRGYDHSGVFRALQKADPSGEWAEIGWSENWVVFLDSILQLQCIQNVHQGMYLPIRLQKAHFNPQRLRDFMAENKTEKIPAKALKNHKAILAPGFEIRGLKAALAPKRQHRESARLSAYRHLPFDNVGGEDADFEAYLNFCLTIAIDSTPGNQFTVLEFADSHTDLTYCQNIKDQLPPKIQKSYLFLVSDSCQERETDVNVLSKAELKKRNAVLVPNLIIMPEGELSEAEDFMDNQCFLLCISRNWTEVPNHLLSYQKVARQPGLTLYRRKQIYSQDTVKAVEVQECNFNWVENVKKELHDAEENSRLYLYSNSTTSGLHGFVQCLRQEGYNQLRCFEALHQDYAFDFGCPSPDLKETMDLDLVYNVYSSGAWGCFTRTTLETTNTVRVRTLGYKSFAHILQPGDLSSIKWIQSPVNFTSPDSNNSVLCEVSYSALNFRDVMLATGKLARDALPGDCAFEESILGLEFSGVLRDGTRVFGIQAAKCLATTVEINENLGFVLPVPESWTLAEAATVAVAYGTVYYALVVKGKISEEETVLIHAGAGGVGQAAIAVALSRKCQVITTVSTEEKREFLKDRFPQLTDASFADSRDPVAFEDHVMEVTGGRGVDIVLNSLSQESLKASVRCLGSSGRFLEIGKFDLFNNSDLGMELFLRSIEFHGVLLDYLFQSNLPPFALEERKKVKELILEGIASGEVTPLSQTEFNNDQVEEAFRFMASGKHMGKVLIKIRDDPQAPADILALPRTYFYPHKVYILVGGLGGMGLEIADWMISRGARNLVFVSRSNNRSWYQKYRIKGWQARGVAITITTSDVTSRDGVRSLLEIAGKLGPIGGIFNLAVILKDAMFTSQTAENFEVVSRPKIIATSLLDQFSRDITSLDLFVVFSSIIAQAGNSGQSNYGFANSTIERICMQRRAVGLHGLAIRWGPIGDVGVYHSMTGGRDLPIGGLIPQRIHSVLSALDVFLKSSSAVVSSFVLESSMSKKEDTLAQKKTLVELVAHVLGIKNISNINSGATFTELGMDSLMGTEIRQLLERKLNMSVASATVMSMTFAKLADMESNKISLDDDDEKGQVPQTPQIEN